ncbi:MAG: hypothetical protein KDC38_06100, partial [Planctomycetes bacterium]|nr:hypothetical protein [Planctomycetota bacterium]
MIVRRWVSSFCAKGRGAACLALALALAWGWGSSARGQCPSVTALSVTTNCTTQKVEVDWVNPAVAISGWVVRVTDQQTGLIVQEIMIDQLPGQPPATSAEIELPGGNYGVQVAVQCVAGGLGIAGVPHAHAASFGDPYNVVVPYEDDGGEIDSSSGWLDFMAGFDKSYMFVPSLTDICVAAMGPGDVVWVLCGTFPDSHQLTMAEGNVLKDLTLAGVAIYLEGADIWGFDPQTAYADYDGVNGRAGGVGVVPDGDDSCNFIVGEAFGGLDLTGWSEVYPGDQAGNDSTDRLIPTGQGPAPADLHG